MSAILEAPPMIPADKLDFHPHSFADQRMRLFRWNGTICRALSRDGAVMFQRLLGNGTLRRLSEKGLLIETKESSLSVEGFDMVLEHRALPFVSYPNEWCAAMLRDAALVLMSLAIELAEQGYTLGDGHPWNLVYDFCRPLFVDVGSITTLDDFTWPSYDEFCRFCLYPLVLMSAGQGQVARLLMCEDKGVQIGDVERLVNGYSAKTGRSWRSSLSHAALALRGRVSAVICRKLKTVAQRIPSPISTGARQQAHLDFLHRVKQEVEQVHLPGIETSHTGNASAENTQPVIALMEKLKPASVLDVHCQDGSCALAAARLGSSVVTFSNDEASVTQLYQQAREANLPILPLLMDFTKPTPERGLGSHWAIAATDRLECEMVLALDLVHHLVRERHLNFEHISEGLARFAKRWALVEFAPPGDCDADRALAERCPNYTLANFLYSLRKRFNEVTIHASARGSRVLILAEK